MIHLQGCLSSMILRTFDVFGEEEKKIFEVHELSCFICQQLKERYGELLTSPKCLRKSYQLFLHRCPSTRQMMGLFHKNETEFSISDVTRFGIVIHAMWCYKCRQRVLLQKRLRAVLPINLGDLPPLPKHSKRRLEKQFEEEERKKREMEEERSRFEQEQKKTGWCTVCDGKVIEKTFDLSDYYCMQCGMKYEFLPKGLVRVGKRLPGLRRSEELPEGVKYWDQRVSSIYGDLVYSESQFRDGKIRWITEDKKVLIIVKAGTGIVEEIRDKR